MNKDRDHLYRSLLLALGQEYEHYEELLRAVEAEAQVIGQGDPLALADFNARNERLLLSLNMAAGMREQATRDLAAVLQLAEPVPLKTLAAYAEGATRKGLMDYREKFSGLLGRIRRGNDRNRELIALSLTHVNHTLRYLHTLTSSSPNYNQLGEIKAGNLHGRLISEAG